jgi:hypothetical protein
LILGLLGDALLRATPWGLNAPLWIGALALSILAVAAWHNVPLTGGGRWLLIPAVIFAAGFTWRDSFTLQACYLLAVLIALALVAQRSLRGRVRVAGLIDYATALILAGVHAAFSALTLLFGDIPWKRFATGGVRLRQIASVSAGLLLALPIVVIFGALLTSADAVFDQLVRHLFDWDIDQLLWHGITIGFWSWLTAGFLRQTFLVKETRPAQESASPAGSPISLGIVEIGTALGALNGLFFAFVVVQFRYLFGGEAALRAVINLSYSEYARRGFFELVEVAALVLPLLLAAHYLLKKDRASHVRIFNALAAITIGLLFIIMLSAVLRMKLYTDEFGLTELRLHTTAFMLWLALVFGWFGMTVLRGRRERFAFGGLVAGFVVLTGLSVLNPDQLIVRVNAARVEAAYPFDAEYPTHLSADAVPALIEALPAMTDEDRCAIAAWLLGRWSPPSYVDLRTWNWSRAQAWQAVAANQPYLQSIACPAVRD